MGQFDHFIQYLPQKPPFLFVEEILEWTPFEHARGAVFFGANHHVFENHLPGEPLVPGVILIEALAQLSGLVLIREGDEQPIRGYLGEVCRMRFRKRVGPGKRVFLAARLSKQFGNVFRFETSATVDDEVVAEGEITVAGMGARDQRSEVRDQ